MKKTKIKQVTNHKIFKMKMKILSQKNTRTAKIFIVVDHWLFISKSRSYINLEGEDQSKIINLRKRMKNKKSKYQEYREANLQFHLQ
jgi:hypothetical protein